MRPMRRFGGGGSGFGLAGVESMAAKLTIALVVGSVLALVLKERADLILLLPQQVIGGLRLWQPFTFGFVAVGPLGIIFGAIILYTMGGNLESMWGPRRLLGFVWGGTVIAGVLTTVLMGVVLHTGAVYAGGGTMMTLVWVAYGLSIGRGQSNFWGIPVTGNVMAAIGAGFVVLNALTAGWASQVPEFFAIGLAFAYVRGGSPRSLWLRLRQWQLQRQMRGRASHLRVMPDERPHDRYLN